MSENLVPWLRKGTGRTPKDGGCIMQVVDWINRNEWTDHPPCVHPVIQTLAIQANDSLDDAGRQKLLDLAPRMMNTASSDKNLAVQLAIFCAERVLPIFEAKHPNDDRPRKAIEAAKMGRMDAANAAAYAANAAANADAKFDLLAAAYAYAANAAYAAYYAAYAAAYAAANAANTAVYAANAAANAANGAANAANGAANAAGGAANAAYVARPLDLLLAVLDEYDRLTNRDKVEALDFAPVCAVMA